MLLGGQHVPNTISQQRFMQNLCDKQNELWGNENIENRGLRNSLRPLTAVNVSQLTSNNYCQISRALIGLFLTTM